MREFTEQELVRREKAEELRKLGIDEKLESMDVPDGAIVKILDFEFEYHK